MVILGIDPGIATTGQAIITKDKNTFRPVFYNAIITSPKTPFPTRLKELYEAVSATIDLYHPDFVAVEELFFNTNIKTAITVAQARGVIVLAAANKGVEYMEYTPLQVKQAVVGYGRATKDQVQKMVKSMLNLEKIPKPDDVADALAVAICHGQSYHHNRILLG